MLTRKQKKKSEPPPESAVASVLELECEVEESELSESSDSEGELTCPVEIAERELSSGKGKKTGRPCLGPKKCDSCGAAFKGSYELKEHKRFHKRTKGQQCPICGKWVITNNTDYFQKKDALSCKTKKEKIM